MAIGALKVGYDEALSNNLDISAGHANCEENIAKQTAAWSYLVLSLCGVPGLILSQVTVAKDPHHAWAHLHDWYALRATNQSECIKRDMEDLEFKDPYEDPLTEIIGW